MKEINFVHVDPITGDLETAYAAIKRIGSRAIPVPAKGAAWNTGHTNYNEKQAWKIYNSRGKCRHVIELWFRADGFNHRAFKYRSESEYEKYEASNTIPYNIENEIGMTAE